MGFCSNGFKTSCITSHLHYNYIFMHFGCLLYMLNCLCAVRIGLGRAYDAFIFACHMFVHFHTYIPSILYNLIYFLVGAPKRKSTPSRNLLHSGASSSSLSDPSPSHVRFCDEKAKSDFSENFS